MTERYTGTLLQFVTEFAQRDASFGDDRLLHSLVAFGFLTREQAGGYIEQRQHPSVKMYYEHYDTIQALMNRSPE